MRRRPPRSTLFPYTTLCRSAYVEYARRRTSDPRLEFRVGDACAIPFPEASFDRVLSLLMLHFVPNARAAVAEMRRVARPGSRSEEHTSELQSRQYLVCRLLL